MYAPPQPNSRTKPKFTAPTMYSIVTQTRRQEETGPAAKTAEYNIEISIATSAYAE
jgi:hypothetical protein